MNISSKRKLANEELEKLGLSIGGDVWEFSLEKVIEERCDEFENELEFNGWEIVEREYTPIAASIFNFKVIAQKI